MRFAVDAGGGVTPERARFRLRHPGPTCRASPSASTASPPVARANPAAPGSAGHRQHVLGLHGARLEIASEVGRQHFACRFNPDRVHARRVPPHRSQHRHERRASPDLLRDPRCTPTASCRSWTSISACWRRRRMPSVPLLERLRYLCISCTNLDEFFRDPRWLGAPCDRRVRRPALGRRPVAVDLLNRIHDRAAELVEGAIPLLYEELRPALADGRHPPAAARAVDAGTDRLVARLFPQRDHAGAVAAGGSTPRIRSRRSSTSR